MITGSEQDHVQIRDLAALYMRGLDRLDREVLRAQFWDDAYLEYGIYEGGPDDFVDFCMSALKEHERNHHMLGQHLIDVSGAEAYGEVYYQAYHKIITDDTQSRDLIIAGRYIDRCEKRNGVWKFSYRAELVDWMREEPSADAMLADTPMLVGQRMPEDLVYHRARMRRNKGDLT